MEKEMSHPSDKEFFTFLGGDICRLLCADMSFEYYDVYANDERRLVLKVSGKTIGNVGLSNVGICDGKVNYHEVAKVVIPYFYERIKERLVGVQTTTAPQQAFNEKVCSLTGGWKLLGDK